MLKKRYEKKILAFLLAALLLCSEALPGIGTLSVQAANAYENENLLVNPDFEEDTAFSPAGGSHAGNWFVWQNVAKTTDDAQSGTTSVKFTGNDSALEQDVPGLQTGMTYVYTVWAKLSEAGNGSANHTVGVKNYGGDEIKHKVTSTDWEKIEIEFTYTGGTPRVYGYTQTRGNADMYIDNASVTVKSDIQRVSIENGMLNVTFRDSFAGTPEAFTATFCTDADSENVRELPLTPGTLENNVLPLTFSEIEKLPVAQTVTVNLTYQGQTITLDFSVEASGEEVVTAQIASVNASNGSVIVSLDKIPTIVPSAGDFTWEYRIGDGEYRTLEVKDFRYDSSTGTVTVSFDEIRGIPEREQNVTVKVSYGEQSVSESSFIVPVGTSRTFYVDSTLGSDTNDGATPETAIASIDKLNTITYLPGDSILFKKGETFTGCFQPKGSGTAEAPVTIGSYGDENAARPKLMPGPDWTVPYIMSANAMVRNAKVNYVIRFYNVEYWEVSGLEIMDPNSEAYLTRGSDVYIGNSANDVYRSGITIQAEDIGILEHFYIDNVIIHGFHGPGTNIGKTSGGITMNVITNESRNRELSIPTQINDIRITNCEIYDVGRSGINFLTPWSFRTEEKWGPFDYGTRGYDYLPYEDFYMANNYIHDIDGDGTIIDNCSGAVAEYNLVTRCCLRPATEGGGAAVGLFNWNSDDTVFQFNEVYDIKAGSGASASNDSQGIEIDALNDRTWVQYNYVHDNAGGFMMLCNVSDNYRSFDGIIRYNISQNDYAHPRQGMFDIYSANYGTEVYNNTFYMTERALRPNSDEIFLFSAAGAYDTMKFYNNIFYYDGAVPAAANKFADSVIDWQSNIFYGFTNLPENDNPGTPNLNTDPKLKAAGTGATGSYPGDIVDLSCYHTEADSPAVNAGVPMENNGGRDYFGNPVTGIPDIGAYESGSVELKILSDSYAVDQNDKTVTVSANDKVTAQKLLESLIYEDGVTIEIKRGSGVISGGVRIADGDTVTAAYNGEKVSYTVKLEEGQKDRIIPVEDMIATAGSEETSQSNDRAANVLDGSIGTIWHTAWGGAAAADKYITIELTNDYEVSGYIYTPRTGNSSGAANGVITRYEIYVSDDNTTWEKAAEGNWAQDSTVKTVEFDAPVQAKYVKLLAVEGKGGFASAAEIRLIGERVYSDHETPSTPAASSGEVTGTSAEIRWSASSDNAGVTEYRLLQDGKVIAVFEPDVLSFTVADLNYGTEYVFSVVAVDEAGNLSEAGSIAVTTLKDPEEPSKVDKKELQSMYDSYISKKSDYTEESWKEFEKALSEAKKVLDNESASAEDVAEAAKLLGNAADKLVKKTGSKPDTNKEENSGSGNSGQISSDKKPVEVVAPEKASPAKTSSVTTSAPSTGDGANPVIYASLLLLGICTVCVVRKKRKGL